MKKCASELELEAFIREHLAGAHVDAERDSPVYPGQGAVFSPGGGLPGLCFGDSVSFHCHTASFPSWLSVCCVALCLCLCA
jgi:hypothetical protein